MTLLGLTMLGAAAGAPARWWLDQVVQSRHRSVFPWGTVTINTVGSLLLGGLLAAAGSGHATQNLVALVGTGFCGGFTTFSTFAYETVHLAEEGAVRAAVANVAATLALGMLAAALGWVAATALTG